MIKGDGHEEMGRGKGGEGCSPTILGLSSCLGEGPLKMQNGCCGELPYRFACLVMEAFPL